MPTRENRAKSLGVPVSCLPDGRGRHRSHVRGASHHRWNKKRIVSSHGYTRVRVGKEHPLADPNGYVYEHLIVWVSAGFGLPENGLVIHHKNEDKQDNRISNLETKERSRHNAHHNKERQRDLLGRFLPKDVCVLLDGVSHKEMPR